MLSELRSLKVTHAKDDLVLNIAHLGFTRQSGDILKVSGQFINACVTFVANSV